MKFEHTSELREIPITHTQVLSPSRSLPLSTAAFQIVMGETTAATAQTTEVILQATEVTVLTTEVILQATEVTAQPPVSLSRVVPHQSACNSSQTKEAHPDLPRSVSTRHQASTHR